MKHYKIVLTTELSQQWNSGWYYKSGFEKNGHTVITFSTDSGDNSGERARRLIRQRKPDFILHLKDELPVETFEELRKGTRVIMWYPDPVIPEWLPPYVRACDVFFTMSEGLVEEFRQINPHSYWLSQAFEPSAFRTGEITDQDEKLYSSDVAFVGNLGSKPEYLPRRRYLQRVLRSGVGLKWWGPRLPRKLSTIPLIFGKLGRSYGGKFVWGGEHAKIARLSKIYLGFDAMPHVRKSMSERLYIAVGCGAFYMCRHVEGIEDVLEPGKEIVTFHTEDEMIDMIKYYLRNDDLRMKIAEAGRQRVLREHTYEIRMRRLIKTIEDAV